MIQEIHPSKPETINLLSEHIEQRKKLEVFFPLWDGEFSDYCGIIEWKDGRYDYIWSGHGIGSNHGCVSSPDEMIERILSDNQRFNPDRAFHIKIENKC